MGRNEYDFVTKKMLHNVALMKHLYFKFNPVGFQDIPTPVKLYPALP
ncbi:hypothetical protein J2799_002175 [Chryseobacterium vietnamense]|jgi:hypothetical protein|nr:hypothetical protein [Chryseobacterium vietnamense]